MKWPFHDYKPQIDYRELIKPGQRSRAATANAERHDLKAIPDSQPFADGVAQRLAATTKATRGTAA